ncbi:hypothetical protein CBL_06796 [Carabus blaptoides fortunei]
MKEVLRQMDGRRKVDGGVRVKQEMPRRKIKPKKAGLALWETLLSPLGALVIILPEERYKTSGRTAINKTIPQKGLLENSMISKDRKKREKKNFKTTTTLFAVDEKNEYLMMSQTSHSVDIKQAISAHPLRDHRTPNRFDDVIEVIAVDSRAHETN